MQTENTKSPVWMKFVLIAAGIYNLIWGVVTIIYPEFYFNFAGMSHNNFPEIWQCVGMIVGVYGIGYLIAAYNPIKHWPIILVGLIGKILGPIGYINAYYKGTFTLKAGIINITNDLIWWIPFSLILWHTYQYYHKPHP